MMYDINNDVISANVGSFADVTRVWSGISHASPDIDTAKLQNDLNAVYSWADKNGAPFNEKKFIHLIWQGIDIPKNIQPYW